MEVKARKFISKGTADTDIPTADEQQEVAELVHELEESMTMEEVPLLHSAIL